MNDFLDRRLFVIGAAALGASAVLPSIVSAQVTDARPPTVDPSNIKEIADGVFVIGDKRVWLVPNIGIVLGSDAALVIDTGLGPANGEAVLNVARRLAGSRRLFLTMTHFHPEHGYGAQVFRPDATILYNRAQRDELAEKGEKYIQLFRQTQSPAAAAALEGTKIVSPHAVYDGASTEIDLGGRKVELRTWGAAHTRGDQTIFLPQERILFAGDLIEERMFPIFPYFPPVDVDLDGIRWANVLNDFQRLDPKVIVPGHGDLSDISIALNLASHIETVGRQVRALRTTGTSPDKVLADLKPKIMQAYQGWDHPNLLDLEIRYFAAQA